jgi:hypothetical protein
MTTYIVSDAVYGNGTCPVNFFIKVSSAVTIQIDLDSTVEIVDGVVTRDALEKCLEKERENIIACIDVLRMEWKFRNFSIGKVEAESGESINLYLGVKAIFGY